MALRAGLLDILALIPDERHQATEKGQEAPNEAAEVGPEAITVVDH